MTALPKMLSQLSSPSSIRQVWSVLKSVPGGGRLMGGVVGRMAPYTGTIRPEIVELDIGHAVVRIRDRKAVRNHLNSVHACALMNLGEACTGVAMMMALPEGTRGIPIHLAMEYVKKSRGTITCTCDCETPSATERKEYEVKGELKDDVGDVVARITARWMIGPK
jgi:acyl-coenzyme A thioesterase PaaI-like protein